MKHVIDDAGDWAMVAAQLPADWQALAVEYGVIKPVPAQLGAKITSADVLLRLVLFHVALNVSLKVTCAAAAAAGIIDISAVALHLRMRTCGPYLAALLAKMNSTRRLFRRKKWAGFDIRVVDATVVNRPGAKGTTARVHYLVRLADLGLVECHVTDEKVGETFRHFNFIRGELVIGDRGYANPPGIRHVDDTGAKVMVRHNFGSLPLYDRHGVLLNVEDLLRRIERPGHVRDWPAFVHPKDRGSPIRGRLVATRLPPEKAEEARRRVRKEMGSSVTARALRTAEFVVVFTTVPRSCLSGKAVLALYTLRWQVELRIKRDKSIGGLDRLPNFRADTIHAWLCAKLLAQQIASQLAASQVAFPPASEVGRAAIHDARTPDTRGVGVSGNQAHLARHSANVENLLRRSDANRRA